MTSTKNTPNKLKIKGDKILNISVKTWFLVAVIGQYIFAYYIAVSYGSSAVTGDFDNWNETLTHGYVPGETMGNFTLAAHLLIAAIITIGGPLQFVSEIRARFPIFHRWNGRIFISTALIMSITGLYLSYSGRNLVGDGDLPQLIAITIGAFLIIIFALLAFRTAVARDFKAHRGWALRLFLLVNGVWFFRIGLMFWLFINNGPAGFDIEAFRGPFLTFLAFAVFSGVLTLTILELYLIAQAKAGIYWKFSVAFLLFGLTIIMGIGIFAATMGLWLPRV